MKSKLLVFSFIFFFCGNIFSQSGGNRAHSGGGTGDSTTSVLFCGGGPVPSILSQTNEPCNSNCVGAVTLSVTGGTLPYTYSWSPVAGNTASLSALCASSYTCYVRDGHNCLGVKVVTITEPAVLSITPTQTNSCFGSSNGSATATVSGGSGPGTYTYSWTPSGGTAATASPLAPNTYTCTATDANSCPQVSQTFVITQPAAALAVTPSQTNVLCHGNSTGSATAAVTGGTGAGTYTYSWTPSGGTAATASLLAANTYTCSITDANNCPASHTFTITEPTALSVTPSQTNIMCHGTSTGSATATMSGGTGAGTYTYSWTPSGGTAATASLLAANTYTCSITDANNCPASQTFIITQPASGLSVTPSQTNILCHGSSTGSATVGVTGGTGAGTYTYSWTPSGGTAATASLLAANTYTCSITDANNCPASQTFIITQPAALSVVPTQTNVLCNGGSTGSATATLSGGTGAGTYTYSWTPSGGTAATASLLAANTYTCSITDANNCPASHTFVITQPAALAVVPAQTNVSCSGIATGSATVTVTGGTGAGTYTYSWTPSGGTASTASSLPANTYTCSITDANNCPASHTFIITQPASALAVTPSQTNVLCHGNLTGSATVAVTGGSGPGTYTYSWTPSGGTAATASLLAANTYTCSIIDASNCPASHTFVITQPVALSVIPSQVNVLCHGNSTGSAAVNVSGGTGAGTYTYSWAPTGGASSTISLLPANTYTCSITDANNCPASQTFIITQPASALAVIPTQTNVLCHNGSTGIANANVSGGTGPGTYTYSWTPSGGTAATASSLAANTYTCSIKDANNCVLSQTFLVLQPPVLSGTNTPVAATCALNNGSASASISGGTGGTYTYSWSPASGNTATLNGLAPGTYTCSVTDSNACPLVLPVTIVNNGLPPAAHITPSGPTTFCVGGTVVLTATGGTTYLWNNASTASSITVNSSGTDFVVATTSCGSDTATIQVTVNPFPNPVISGIRHVCFGDSTILSASGGTSYSWSNGKTTPSISISQAGTYVVTATTPCGSANALANVLEYHVTAGFAPNITYGINPLPVNFAANGGNASAWSWSFGDGNTGSGQTTTNTFTQWGDFTVTLTASDTNGCHADSSIVIHVLDKEPFIKAPPNFFTPNGDGVNDEWHLTYANIKQYDGKIFDRWGALMTQLSAPGQSWDGRDLTGIPALPGTYYYVIGAIGIDGTVFNLTGFITLYR